MRERISVCIATYNGEKYIQSQIESILPQLAEYDEVIISDDSSIDETLRIIKGFNDDRIKIFDNQQFRSPIFNFENAIKHTTGEIIFLADQDDIWLENKVVIMLAALENHDLVLSNAIIVDADLNYVKDSYFEWRNSHPGVFKNFIRNSYLGCCIAFKRKILSIALPFPKNIPMHDMWLGMIAELYYNPIFINEKLILYRRHNGNTTLLTKDFTSNESALSKLRFRLDLLTAIIRRALVKAKFK